MASTYSSNLKLQLMGTGDNAGTWGAVTNVNLGTALEESIAGTVDIAFSSGDVTLTLTDANTAQPARNMRLNLTGTSGGARNLIVPAIEKMYVVNNALADACTVKVSGQTGVLVPAGKTTLLFNNGTDVVNAITDLSSLTVTGNVGIGTTSPTEPLDVVGTIGSNVSSTGDFNFKATSTGGGQYRIYPDDATTANPTWFHQTNSSEDQAFVIGGVERVRITSSGDVGIGTTSPLTQLVTVGTSMATSQAFVGSVADTSYSGGILNLSNSSRSVGITSDPTNAGTGSLINFSVDGSERMRIDSAGNMLLGTTSSTTDLAYAPKLKLSGNGPAVYLEETDTSQSWSISALSSGFYIRDATASAIRLFINSSGNVGIGTNTPTSRLEVTDETDINMNSSGTGHLEIDGNGYNFAIALNASGANLYTNSASRSLIFGTDETERMRITGAGNVGIGLTNPLYPLNVSTTSGTIARFASTTNTAAFEINAPIADYIALKAMVGDGLIFSTGNTEAMRITTSKDVLIGKTTTGYTTPGVRLAGQGYGSNFAHNTAGQTNVLFSAPVSQAQVSFYRQDTGGFMGQIINGATNSVAYQTSSDYRLKEDWQPMSSSVDRVKALNPVNFAWKVDGSRVDGFLAHEVQDIVPEAISGIKDAVDDKGNPVYQGIDQSKLVPLLTAALQEAITRIETLEARVTALES